MKKLKNIRDEANGFTLIEILIALFIFTILSVLLMSGLHSVINVQSGSENKAERLRQLQMSLLQISRDLEQAVNRPIINEAGKEDAAFIGMPTNFVLTHLGAVTKSALQRTGYTWKDNILSRITWPVLDQAPKTKQYVKSLLKNISNVRFEYLDNQNRFHEKWPITGEANQALPNGVKISLTIENWGSLTQFYLIPAKDNMPAQPKEKTGS